NNIQIKIGEENSIEEAKNYSVVLGNCIRNGKVLGTIGIIGLTRMDYAKIVTMVKFLIDFINTNID
ncbi:Putative heat-inducible transcription repressor hrcA, partial [Candidatus Arthromitus sp. SFB-5]